MDRIDDLTADCFNFLIQLRRLDPASQPPPESVHQRLRGLIDTMSRRATEMGFSNEDSERIKYAIVALADEVVIQAGGNLRQYWVARPLQLQYFNTANAGEDFFGYLEGIRQEGRSPEVLRVFYLCLALGFQGRYRVRGGDAELAALTDALAADLARQGQNTETLSPHGDRPRGEARGNNVVTLPVIGLSIGALMIAVALYVGLRWQLNGEVEAVLQRISALVQH